MKKFKEYINEEITPQALTDKNFVGVENSSVRDNINSLLSGVTTKSVVTPYVSLERVRKALAYYHIFLPAHQFMEGNSGNVIFNISQFGEKYGQTNTGEFVSKSDSPYFLYFEYQMNDLGLFDVFAEVVDDDELEEILGDYESEMDDSEEDDDDEDDTVVSADQQNNYLLNKDEHDGNLKEERLNELREPKKPSKEHKKDVIDTTTKHSYKDYDDAHGKNVDARKKYMRDKTPESKDEVDRTEADRVKKGKRARILQRKSEKLKEGMMDWAKSKLGLGSSPDIRRMPDSKMDADVSKGINDYNNDQSEKEMSNAVKTSWMMSSNPTYKNRGRRRAYQDVDSNAKRETMRDKFIDKQNTRDIRRLNELRDETKAGYALKAADQITDYVANRTAYDASSEGEKKTKQLQKRIRGLQMLDRSEKKKKKIKAILKSRMKKRSAKKK